VVGIGADVEQVAPGCVAWWRRLGSKEVRGSENAAGALDWRLERRFFFLAAAWLAVWDCAEVPEDVGLRVKRLEAVVARDVDYSHLLAMLKEACAYVCRKSKSLSWTRMLAAQIDGECS